MIKLEDIFNNKEILEIVKESIQEHSELLLKVNEVLSKLVKSHPEIFRRKEESRIKTIRSLVRKFNLKNVDLEDIETELSGTEDISGVRLTIATKDQYSKATELIEESLKKIGKLNLHKRKSIELDEKSGYSAVHHVLTPYDSGKIRCEIQIRTLTADLWAVFTHYESYKNDNAEDPSKRDELVNYARLMDVADHYAKLIRERKIVNANNIHQENCKSSDKVNSISVEELQDILYTYAKKKRNGKDEYSYVTKVNIIELCDLMTLLSDSKIYTSDDVYKIISNTEAITYIGNEIKKSNLKFSKKGKKQNHEFLEEVKERFIAFESETKLDNNNYLINLSSMLTIINKKIINTLENNPEMDILSAFKILIEMRKSDTAYFDSGKIDSKMKGFARIHIEEWRNEVHYDYLLSKID